MPRRKADKPGPLVPCCLMPADESNSNSSDSNHSNAFNWVATQQPHSQNFQRQHSPHCRHSSLSQQMTPEQQTSSNEQRGRLLEFVERLSSTTSSIEMQMHTNKYLQELTNSTCVFMVPLLPSSEEGLIQVVADRPLDKIIRFSVPSSGFTDETLTEGFHVLNKDPGPDLTEIIDLAIGTNHDEVLVFDIKNTKRLPSSNFMHQTSLYVCMKGPRVCQERYRQMIKETFRYILGHLCTSFDLFEETLVRKQCQTLMHIAQRLLSKIGDLGSLLRGVMVEAKNMTSAERCSLFLIDEYTGELVSKVFDGDEARHEIRIAAGQGIAGNVAQTGKLLNIRDAYTHPLFFKGMDELTGFKTRNILCFPICNENEVIGVAQLCNKHDGFYFDKCDEQIATAFSAYCGISIMHSMVHKQMQKSEARQKLSQELLTYHMKVRDEDVESLRASMADTERPAGMPSAVEFTSFDYNPRECDRIHTARLSMQMFFDLQFVELFKMRDEKLARFMLTVQKGYRDTVPYHNWTHAFSVAHFGFTLLHNLKLVEKGILSNLDALSLLIACFCHDLDHRGTNNSFQMEVKSPLARLYSSEGSVNERHHLSQAICLINEQQSRILDGMSEIEFKECIDGLRELILATDLAHHFGILKDLKDLTVDTISANKRNFLSLLMTCCDLSDQARPWATNEHVAGLVYSEFFAQGDMERQIGLSPNAMMDRQRACVPQIQIDFIDACVYPTFSVLSNLFPETQQFVQTIQDNRAHWLDRQAKYDHCVDESSDEGTSPSTGGEGLAKTD